MGKLKSEYPTDGQMKEMWEALESGDDRAILAVLHKRQEEMKAAEDISEGAANSQHAGGSIEGANTFHKR
ncbi:MAG: hypothetical protein WA700_01825 [Acidobacteriaceae bacterium]